MFEPVTLGLTLGYVVTIGYRRTRRRMINAFTFYVNRVCEAIGNAANKIKLALKMHSSAVDECWLLVLLHEIKKK